MFEAPSRDTNSPAAPVNGGPPWPAIAPRRRRAWPWVIGALGALLVLAGVAAVAVAGRDEKTAPTAASSQAPRTLAVTGHVVLHLGQFVWTAMPSTCTGYGGYNDITVGADVTVTDPAGKVVALGKLSNPVPQMDPEDPERATQCWISFEVTGVPAGLGFYGVEVSRRGVIRQGESELTGIQLGF